MSKELYYIGNLPKGELHVHLNGAVPTSYIKRLLGGEVDSIPEGFDIERDLNILNPRTSLVEYLKPWQVLNLIPKNKEDLNEMVLKTFLAFRLENIKFAEVRNTIFYISELNRISIEEAIVWVLEALSKASSLTGVKSGLIITIRRSQRSSYDALKIVRAIKNLDLPHGVIGLDLAGNEDLPVADDLPFIFKKAKHELNLGITIHAGETGSLRNILQAVNLFEADRIGHGTAAVNCMDTMELLRERNVAVEVCPISNKRTGSIKNNDPYTFHQFLKYEVPFVICSDNPAIHNASISDDYSVFLKETNDFEFLKKQYVSQKKYSFLRGEQL